MTTPDPSRIREGFARAFPGHDFDRAVARLDKLVGRFIRMGSFTDATIAMARDVDNGGGRTTISDADFALVAFFAGAGRLWLVSDPSEPSGMERLALAEETLTGGAGRPELVFDHDLGAHVYREPREQPAPEEDPRATLVGLEVGELPTGVELFVELGLEDITDDVKLGALAPIVYCIRGISSYLNTPLPWSMVDVGEIHTMLIPTIHKALRIAGYDTAPSQISMAVTIGGRIRLHVDDELAHRITAGAHGRPFDEVVSP